VSKIRDAMKKAEGEVWRPESGAGRSRGASAKGDGPRGLVPPLSGDVLAHYEAVGKQVEVALGNIGTANLLFTGAVGGDGISTVAAQYGEMLARRGERVLMIDGNPRHPSLHRQFHLPDAPGLAEYVAGSAPLEAVIHATGFANLELVPLGRCSDRSEAERVTEALGEFQQTVAERYDYVLTDTDFIGSPFFSQTAVGSADGVILVLRAGKTNRQIAARALDTVKQVEGRVLGVILNRREFPIPNFIYRRL
jgi:capsular exopolysaccharide synthesis family protein